MNITYIKLMTDYQCFPLWWAAPHDPGNIDPSALPLSSETIARLIEWADMYDATLNMDDPAASGFPNDQAEVAFEHAGMLLWQSLREELGTAYEVWYFSNQRQRLFKNPDDIDAATV